MKTFRQFSCTCNFIYFKICSDILFYFISQNYMVEFYAICLATSASLFGRVEISVNSILQNPLVTHVGFFFFFFSFALTNFFPCLDDLHPFQLLLAYGSNSLLFAVCQEKILSFIQCLFMPYLFLDISLPLVHDPFYVDVLWLFTKVSHSILLLTKKDVQNLNRKWLDFLVQSLTKPKQIS